MNYKKTAGAGQPKLFKRKALAALITASVMLTGCSQLSSEAKNVSSLSSAHSQPLPTVNIPYKKFVLDNGLTVVVHEDRKAPVVAVNVWYKVGSKDEPFGKSGFAHLFEHLMFNGSENFNNDFFVPFLSAGATDMNGTTNNDRTNYFQTVPTQALDMALWMESDRMGHFLGAVTQEKLDIQRGVVQNEKRQGENRPYGKSWGQMAQDTFPVGHPYSWSVIGSMEDLDAASLEDVKGWFKQYYGPSNAVIVLAGDIDEKTAKEKVSKYFADIQPGPPLSIPGAWIAKRTGEKRRLIQDHVTQPRLTLSWNIPQDGDKENIEIQLLASILGDGQSSRLYQRLVKEEQLVTDVSASVYSRLLAGQIYISADAKPDADLNKIEAIIREELDKTLQEGVNQAELDQARIRFTSDFIRETERVGGFGGKSDILAFGEVYHSNPGFYKTSAQQLAEATPESIQATGEEWLTDGVYVQTVVPYLKYTAATEGADRSQLPEVGEGKKLDLPDIQRTELSNGLKVVLANRTSTPMVSMRLQFNGGLSSHKFYGSGVPGFTLDMLKEGNEKLDSAALQSELDKLGTTLSTSISGDHASVNVSSLSANLAPSLNLLNEMVTQPGFNQQDINQLQERTLQQIGQEKTTPTSLLQRELPHVLYSSEHPYATPATGSGNSETLSNIKRQTLVNYYNDWIRPDNATLFLVGDVELEQLLPVLENNLAQWQAPEQAIPQLHFPEINKPEKPKVYLINQPDAQQSTIAVAQLLPALSSDQLDEELSFSVFNDLLGGEFTSRINMNLREEKRWSYGARSYSRDTKAQRPYLIRTSVQTDKTGPALEEIRHELKAVFSNEMASKDEVTRYRDNRLKEQAGRFETNDRLLNAISRVETYNLPENYLEQYADLLKGVDTESVREAGDKRLDPETMIWMVVGDLEKIEKEVRELGLGEVEILQPKG
ncbi:M16 family metallopeptidase [Endozoicomonas arenosclerae]|uniref:M16 family metallopeptidase n=1 Tax=Endozoicomonas arenosclerae TaxID=1633495 RepID=UPI000782C505|nr:pitrilysin family protein [Endozoicomonas arenosclerae]